MNLIFSLNQVREPKAVECQCRIRPLSFFVVLLRSIIVILGVFV